MIHEGSAAEITILHAALKDSNMLDREIGLMLKNKDTKAQLEHFAQQIRNGGLFM